MPQLTLSERLEEIQARALLLRALVVDSNESLLQLSQEIFDLADNVLEDK